ncbi:hypothetical protein D9615_003142 [Tricholomella constricta]|uniref:Uncharacterized protein n=1 Tax=Tricholomella constricta TaxID=117010 RepID=A0A8H5M7Y7_9AGAR|nr:hypothetical protein D9615_003142 [Tricholomella constricta]
MQQTDSAWDHRKTRFCSRLVMHYLLLSLQHTNTSLLDMSLSRPLVPNDHKVIPIIPPKNRRCDVKRDFPRLLDVGPLPVLYHHLIPSNKKGLPKPPLIHCGYLAEQEFLFAYARQHGLSQECAGDYEGDIMLLKLDTMYAAVKAILEELKISSIRIRLPHVVKQGGGTRIIKLYSNYSMKRIPPTEDVEKLARFLGMEQEQPKWYFDAKKWRWS